MRRTLADPLSFPLEFKTWLVGYLQDNTILGTASRSISNAAVPTGTILSFGGSTAPTGYLLMDGTAVSRSTYAGLFSIYGTKYGVGDGSTTFNLPDGRGRTLVGFATAGGHTDVSTLGNNDAQAVANRRPKHRTTNNLGTSNSLTLPNHVHPEQTDNGTGTGGGTQISRSFGYTGSEFNSATGNPTTLPPIDGFVSLTGSIGTNVANDALDTPSYLVVNYIIKT